MYPIKTTFISHIHAQTYARAHTCALLKSCSERHGVMETTMVRVWVRLVRVECPTRPQNDKNHNPIENADKNTGNNPILGSGIECEGGSGVTVTSPHSSPKPTG
eukprot:765385_1